MRWSLVLLVACGSSSATEDAKPSVPAPPPRALAPITGAHGGAITLLALTADGQAAVTADATGGVRLWPTLDGTREPIVVHAVSPVALAIGHDGSGFAIAVTDAADHVELVRLDGAGRVRARHALGEAKQTEIAGAHVLALRADQVIDQLAFDGGVRARLSSESGTRVEALLVNGLHAAALVSSDPHHRVKRIALEPFAWGEASAVLGVGEAPAAVLAADGASIVALGKEHRVMQFDLATGKARPACPTSMRKRDHDASALASSRDAAVIGVVEGRVACVVDTVFSWFELGTEANQTASLGMSPASMAVAGGRLVSAEEHQLVIATPRRTMYLGYGVRDLTHVRSVPTGIVIGKGDQEPVLLDDAFRERARFALPKLRVDWTDLVPVDERFIIASSTRPGSGDLWGSAYQIAIYDTVKQVMHQVLPHRARGGELVYEASTRLLVVTDGPRTMLARLENATLGEAVTLDLPGMPKQIALLDPALAGGMIALAIRDDGGGRLVVSAFHRADLPPARQERTTMTARETYAVTGELKGVDRAGRLYLSSTEGVAIHAHGRAGHRLADAQAARLRASPDAKHVVAIDGGRLALFTTAGAKLWETAAWGSSDVDWTPTGVLYARFPHALARIELATGALVERQCGWGFGISATQREGSSTAPSVCDVAP